MDNNTIPLSMFFIAFVAMIIVIIYLIKYYHYILCKIDVIWTAYLTRFEILKKDHMRTIHYFEAFTLFLLYKITIFLADKSHEITEHYAHTWNLTGTMSIILSCLGAFFVLFVPITILYFVIYEFFSIDNSQDL